MNKDVWRLRTYKEGDEKQVVELFNLCFSGGLGMTFGRDVDEWIWRYKSAQSKIFIAELNERIIGAVCETFGIVNFCGKSFQIAMIDDVSTHPYFQRRGVSRTLMNEAIEHAVERDLAGIELHAQRGSMPYKFYSRLGFREYGTVDFALKILNSKSFRSIAPLKLKFLSYFLPLFTLKLKKPFKRGVVKLLNTGEALPLLNKWSSRLPNYSPATPWHLSRREIIVGAVRYGSLTALASVTPRILVTSPGIPQGLGIQLGDLSYREDAETRDLQLAIMKCLELSQGIVAIAASGDKMVSNALKRCGFFVLRKFFARMYLALSNDFKRSLDGAKDKTWFTPYENVLGEP